MYFTSIQIQVLTTYTNFSRFCFLGTTPLLAPNVWATENPKVDTHSRESNLGPQDCEADALPRDHGHHDIISISYYFSYIKAASAPIYIFMEFLLPELHTESFPNQWTAEK